MPIPDKFRLNFMFFCSSLKSITITAFRNHVFLYTRTVIVIFIQNFTIFNSKTVRQSFCKPFLNHSFSFAKIIQINYELHLDIIFILFRISSRSKRLSSFVFSGFLRIHLCIRSSNCIPQIQKIIPAVLFNAKNCRT